jgi:hypothetical protein
MEMPAFLRAIISWVRAGYPAGVPHVDYIPVFALLGSQLTDAEVASIAETLASEGDPESADAIRAAIKSVTHEQAKDSDIARVRSRLAAGGWPLAKPDRHSWPEPAGSSPHES